MTIRLTEHAKEQASKRGIDHDWIDTTVTHATLRKPDPDGVKEHSYRRIPQAHGGVLHVVHRPDNGDTLVITVYLDRGANFV
jgi:hypothetical protein